MYTTYAFLEIFAAIIILVLFIAGLIVGSKIKKELLILITSFISLLIVDAISWLLIGKEDYLVFYKILWIFSYIFLACCVVSFHRYILSFIKGDIKKGKIVYYYADLLAFIGCSFWLLSLFNGWVYSFDENGMYHYTNFYIILEIILSLSLILDFVVIFRHRKYIGKTNLIALYIYGGLPILTVPLSYVFNTAIITILATSISIILTFVVSYMHTSADLVKKENEIIEKNIDLADKQFKLIYSQIQPHFLYNVLNTIYYLVDEDVEKGKKGIVDFSDYMRMNLDSINKPMLIDFEDELKKTEIYLSLEKLRFEDKLNFEFDIQEKNFKIPQLTLQPIIENAVKHGICKKKGKGKVLIYTRAFETFYEIGILDDGVGFDTNKPLSEEKSHIGLSNIIYRVKHLCNGSVDISSEIGKGTKVIIKLSKEMKI